MSKFRTGAEMWNYYESAYGTEEAREICNRYLGLLEGTTVESDRAFCLELDAAMNYSTIKIRRVYTMTKAEMSAIKGWIKETAATTGKKFYLKHIGLVNYWHNGGSPAKAHFVDCKTGRAYECTDQGVTELLRMVKYSHGGETFVAGYGNTLLDLKRLEANIPVEHKPIESVEVYRMVSGEWICVGHCEQRGLAA